MHAALLVDGVEGRGLGTLVREEGGDGVELQALRDKVLELNLAEELARANWLVFTKEVRNGDDCRGGMEIGWRERAQVARDRCAEVMGCKRKNGEKRNS